MVYPAGRPRRSLAAVTALALGLAQAPLALAAPPEAGISGDTSAGAPKTAILPLVIDGDLPEADRETLSAQLVDGLQRGNFEVITPDELGAAGSKDCDKPGCIQKLAEQTGATHIVRAVVEVVDRDYTVKVELYDGSDGTRVVSSTEGCEICGVVDVGNLVETQAATLRTKLDALASGPASITVSSQPEGAEVTLDGEPFGVTPIDKPIIPGDHVVRVSKEGYIAVQEKRTFVEGARETLSYELEKVPSRLPKRPWGWASLAVGVGAVGAGVTFTALHDQPFRLGSNCTEEDVDQQGNCRYLWGTKWLGMGFSLAGGALVTLGVAILVSTSRSPRKQAKVEAALRRMQVGPGGIGVRF